MSSAPRRIPYVAPPQGTSEIADAIRVRRGTRGLTPLDQTLLNAPEIASGWNSLLGAVRTKNSLPGDVRELMILRVAARNGAAFEWIHHAHVGLDEGLTPSQLSVIRDLATPLPLVSSPAPLTPIQAAALRFADASTFSVHVPSATVDELKALLANDQQLLEATAVVATYNMVSRLLVALDVGDLGSSSVPLPELKQTEHDLTVAEGVTLHVKVGRRASEEGGKWLVFVNSLMTNQAMWDEVLPRLSKTYNIITYDQRGHGASSVPPIPSTLELLAGDIASILKQLEIPTPIHAVIGVSQGGATSLAFARDYPQLFERLVTCDTQATSPAANSKAWDERIALARGEGSMVGLADVTVPRWFPAGSDFVKGGRKESQIYDQVVSTPIEGFATGAAALQGYDVLPGLAEKLKGKKVLLIAGERDGALPGVLTKLKEILKEQGVEEVDFKAIPGCGHLPMVDGPREWLDAVENFLA